jgi:hypothetical protein
LVVRFKIVTIRYEFDKFGDCVMSIIVHIKQIASRLPALAVTATVAALTMGATDAHAANEDTIAASTASAAEVETMGAGAKGPLSSVLSHMFDGEGGEAGLGLSRADDKGVLRVPVLTGPQLRTALVGNTIRYEWYALHFEPTGEATGWSSPWVESDMSKCPTEGGSDYYRDSGKCFAQIKRTISSEWTIKGNEICMPDLAIATEQTVCRSVALILNNVVFLDKGQMVGKGATLSKGSDLAPPAE